MLIIYLFCLFCLMIMPCIEIMRQNEAEVYNQRMRNIRLAWVQKHYPDLKKLSWEEIEKKYSVPELFDDIR